MLRPLLNIASIACLALCVALMGLWVRSYRSQIVLHTRFCNACGDGQKPIVFFMFSSLGRLWLRIQGEAGEFGLLSEHHAVEHGYPKGRLAALGFNLQFSRAYEFQFLMMPYWFLVLASGSLAAAFQMRWPLRFTLRSLFIATTFVAVLMGMIAWLDWAWIGK